MTSFVSFLQKRISIPTVGLKRTAFFYILLIPVWTVISFVCRDLLPWTWISMRFSEIFFFTIAALIAWGLVHHSGPILFDEDGKSREISVYGLILFLCVCLVLAFDISLSYWNYYVRYVEQQNALQLFGTYASDYAFHISYSSYLLEHATLLFHPFFAGAHYGIYLFFDLLVTNGARLIGISAMNSFFILSPLLGLTGVLALSVLLMLEIRGWSLFVRLALIISLFVATKLTLVYPYGLYSLLYLLTIAWVAAGLSRLISKSESIPWLRGFSLSLLFFILLFWMSGLKILVFIGLAGMLILVSVLLLVLQSGAPVLLGQKLRNILLLIILPLGLTFFLFTRLTVNSLHFPVYTLISLDLASPMKTIVQLYYFVLTIILDALRKPLSSELVIWGVMLTFFLYRAIRSREGLFMPRRAMDWLLPIGALIYLVNFFYPHFFVARLDDGGALAWYPKFSRTTITLICLPFLFQWAVLARISLWKKILRAVIPMLFLIEYVLTPNQYLFRGPTESIPANDHMSPDRNVLAGIEKLNAVKNDDWVVTTYWYLNRNYNLTMFLKHPPFLSSPEYGFVSLLADYSNRRRLSEDFFIQGRVAAFFDQLQEGYPSARYILVDNALCFSDFPGRIDQDSENHIFADLASETLVSRLENLPDHSFKGKQGAVYVREIHGKKVYIHSIRDQILESLAQHRIKVFFQNPSCSIYQVE